MGKKWDKFLLLTWKNWLLQWRHPVQTLVEILAPVFFCALLVLLRGLVDPETKPDRFFLPFDPTWFSPNITIGKIDKLNSVAWSPCGNEALENIMNNVAMDLNFTVDCFDNRQDLENGLWDNTEYTIAGVQFDDSLSTRNDIDDNVNVVIRFPSELRTAGSVNIMNTWLTNSIFTAYQVPGPREPDSSVGAQPSYYQEKFLALQYYISLEMIKYYTNNDSIETPLVIMQRFPYPTWIDDALQTALQSFIGLIFMLSFVYTCVNTVKVITTEKEKQLKETMKIMGLPNWLHWTAWFVKIFVFLLISIILMVVLLTVSWFPDTNISVFTLADPFLLFIFLVIYACAIVTFCFAISVFFSKANTATTIAGLVWFLFYVPYLLLQDQYTTLTLAQKILSCLALNTAMAYGIQLTLMWEGVGAGLGWSNLFSPVSPDDTLTMGYVLIMLIADAIIYLLIALYVEAVFPGEYGVPEVWYFPFKRSYWCGERVYAETGGINNLESDVYEKEPSNLNVGIQVNKLRKVFPGQKVAVRDLSFNMFENQITVLLGHNGAGKTTTMSMLTGMIPPTGGTATVNGYDIRNNISGVRDSLGLCPQHNILFDDLTVAEHLYFFSKLKGLDGKEVKQEVNTYIELLDLVPKRNEKSSTLSGGMKRKLSVAIAMCGKSKVCMLDEPTSGMDPAARRGLWDMIQKQKKDRTILLSTHFMDEADLLGDRIIIMADGQLQCCGTSFFLKKKYGAGYHLIMDKSKECDANKVTDLLRTYIPNIKIENNVGSELTYVLPENQSSVFESMLRELESNSKRLGINSYGISLTTMEEVFMKVGTDFIQEDKDNMEANDNNLHLETNGNLNSSSDIKLNLSGSDLLTGVALWRNQFMAMMLKKIHTTYRSWLLVLIQNCIPVAMLIISVLAAATTNMGNDLPRLDISLDMFNDPITVVTFDARENLYYQQFIRILSNRPIRDWEDGNMTEKMIQETVENTARVRMRYIIGASFFDDMIIAWFNNEPYHSPPIALQYIMNTILQQNTDDSHSIQFANHPLPYSSEIRLEQMNSGQTVGFQIAFNLSFAMAFVTSFFALFYIKERVSKSKHLQFVSGARVSTFWFTAILWDFLRFLITVVCIIITLVCFQEDGMRSAAELGRVCLILMLFGLAALPLTYLASFLFTVPSSGFSKLTFIKILLGPAMFMVIYIISIPALNLETVSNALDWIFSIIPHYSLPAALTSMLNIYMMVNLCDQIDATITIPGITSCDIQQVCCDLKSDYFSMTDGMGKSLVLMAVTAVLAMCLLLLIEYRVFDPIIYSFQNRRATIPATEDTEDSDVLEEKRKVRNGEIGPGEYDIVLKDLTKYYSNFLAVNQLCLGIKGYECFGLLGVNGAGKTTTFKMMTGDVVMSRGDAWIRGINLKVNMKQSHKLIGYCPQFDALLDDLTGQETLVMYCLLRGIPRQECSYVAKKLAKDFDFHKHLNKLVKNFSGGNKRKLSAALALIGDPPIVFLDEPTAGMDPATRRHLWNTLCKIRDQGKCLVLTSHSMEECEALCTRLVIMVNGAFKCLGSTQHLKNKFSEGYVLMVKLKKLDSNAITFHNADMAPIENFIKTNFPSAIQKESHQELLTYFIPDMSLSWSTMFGIMERGKREIANLEDYSLGQSSLEQVFLLFTKQQRDENV